MMSSNSQLQQKKSLVSPTSSGRLLCGLLTLTSRKDYTFFVAVTIDDEDSHIYSYHCDADHNLQQLRCCGCQQNISLIKNGHVNHTLLPDGTPCSGSSQEVLRKAQWAVSRWASFHANLKAKAAGKEFFSKEDWLDVVRSVGFCQVKELTEEKYQVLKTFIDRLEAKPDRLRELIGRVKAGEQLVESTNKLLLWPKRPNVQETASSTSLHHQSPAAQMATQSSPQDTSGTQHHSETGSENKVFHSRFKNFHFI